MSVSGDQRDIFTVVFQHLEKVERFAIVLGAGLFTLLLLFALSVGVASATLADGFAVVLRAFSVGVATVLAAGATGALLGFLFGIPRLLQRPALSQLQATAEQQADGKSPPGKRQIPGERFFSTNTSFEEISDWLTKIIIGLGLVQFQTILGYLHTAALFTASYISQASVPAAGSPPDAKVATAVTFCLIVTSLLSACLISYLETRTRLAALFTRMEYAANQAPEATREATVDALVRPIADREAMDKLQPIGSRAESVTRPATSVDRELVTVSFSDLRSPLEKAAWGSAQARSGNFDKALSALTEATTADAKNSGTRLRLAQVLRLKGDMPGYIEAVLKAVEIDPTSLEIADEARSAQLDALYLPPPGGFESAIRLGNYLVTSPLAKDPRVWMYTAAARGQEYRQKLNTATAQELAEIRKAALEAISQVVKLDPDPASLIRKTLAAMYLPGSGVDDDLHVFYPDDEFDKVIGVAGQAMQVGDAQPAVDDGHKEGKDEVQPGG